MKNWMDIIINGYSVNNVEQYSTELYSMENKEITSDLKEKISGKREEILKAKEDEKSFIIRTINNRKHAFVSSVVNLENRDFKLIMDNLLKTFLIFDALFIGFATMKNNDTTL